MNKIKCPYLPCAGVLWTSMDTHCACTLSVNWFNAVSFILRSFRPSVTSGPAFQQTPPFIKNNLGFFNENAGCFHGSSLCVQGGVWDFFLRVDGDDFTATASHQQDPVQTLKENLQELHVWEESSQGIKHTGTQTETGLYRISTTLAKLFIHPSEWTGMVIKLALLPITYCIFS